MSDEYIKSLSQEERIVFLKLFCKLIKADGVIDADEITFLKSITSRYGMDNSVVVSIVRDSNAINIENEARKITDRRKALHLVHELCMLANLDEDLHENELDIIIDASRAMGIEDDKVILINRFVLDSLILAKTGRVIMEEDNG
ncbi:MAG: TerB family tellurite resistance protein [Alphaproteobacteria bacterium]|nr:TerB family tellurite resistance protein [Alphaproteobacteria bacterium]